MASLRAPNNNNNNNNINRAANSGKESENDVSMLKYQLENEREMILNLHNKLTSQAQNQALESAAKLQTIISKSREEIKKARDKYRLRWKEVQRELEIAIREKDAAVRDKLGVLEVLKKTNSAVKEVSERSERALLWQKSAN